MKELPKAGGRVIRENERHNARSLTGLSYKEIEAGGEVALTASKSSEQL